MSELAQRGRGYVVQPSPARAGLSLAPAGYSARDSPQALARIGLGTSRDQLANLATANWLAKESTRLAEPRRGVRQETTG